MALIYFVKRALGFDNTDDETEDEIDNPFIKATKTSDETAERALLPTQASTSAMKADDDDRSESEMPLVDASLPGCIFDSVIRLFNRTMPDFVRECLDTDSQRQYLYHAIESDVRRQMIRVVEEVKLHAVKSSDSSKETLPDTIATDNYKRQLRTSYNNFRREKEALERRILELENSLHAANDENSRLQNEITMLNRRIRRSKSKSPIDDDLQPSLF